MFERLLRASPPARLLRDLDFVAIDLETTGLHAARGDEIVAMAGVRIANGQVCPGTVFDRLVDPGRPVPARAVEIHGITDLMVAGQAGVLESLTALRAFVGDAVIVGYATAFDLGFMTRRRPAGAVAFDRPALCVLRLSEYLDPSMRDHSLESVARRFGVEILGRHTALGDATAAAEIFVRMLPMLEAHGVRTVLQAQRAARRAHFARRLHLGH
ncbi:MAG: PolC-type DNA polymerase III [Alphaproteobacteria bacterium]